MKLYHFTSLNHLRGIALYGLTVGDVPTDLAKWEGRCGVWLTSNSDPRGHGLEGSSGDKSRIRLTVDVPDNACLVRWVDWAAKHVARDTRNTLHNTTPNFESWYVYFGVINPGAIVECVDLQTGEALKDWRDRPPSPLDATPVPPWRRSAWHKKLLKKIANEVARMRDAAASGPFLTIP
jgi:hypothetical protein